MGKGKEGQPREEDGREGRERIGVHLTDFAFRTLAALRNS